MQYQKLIISELSKYDTITILGFGKEGKSTYSFIRKYLPDKKILIHDANEKLIETEVSLKNDKNCEITCGKNYLNFKEGSLIIKSPGISLFKNNINVDRKFLTSQTEIFLKFLRDKTIGITGTKGKSTTTSLVYYILKMAGKKAIIVGNIGLPPLDFIDEIDDDTIIVFELSSHQLESCTISPHISVLLNIYQEHLDYYENFDKYINAKYNIFRFQDRNDYLIYNYDNNILNSSYEIASNVGHIIPYSLKCNFFKNGTYVSSKYEIVVKINDIERHILLRELASSLLGEHNFSNILAAITVGVIYGIDTNLIIESVNNFKGLPHRLEYLGECNGIKFYNDSIATIPEATMYALDTLNDVTCLILGGYDRGVDYTAFSEYLVNKKIPLLLFMGASGKKIAEQVIKLNPAQKFYFIEKIEDIKNIVLKEINQGICLLSPAAASYDKFKNFEERGNKFKNLVSEIIKNKKTAEN